MYIFASFMIPIILEKMKKCDRRQKFICIVAYLEIFTEKIMIMDLKDISLALQRR